MPPLKDKLVNNVTEDDLLKDEMFGHSLANENASQHSQLMYTKAEVDAAIAAAIKANLSQMFNHENYKYTTPPFVIRKFHDHERLSSNKNFKLWKTMVQVDLRALMLLPFIEEENGGDIEVTEERRCMLKAQTMQYLRSSVSRNISATLQNVSSPCVAFSSLSKLYGSNKTQDDVELYSRTERLHFKPGYDPARFVSDFNLLVTEYKEQEVQFSENVLRSMFLSKITSIRDPSSPYFAWYHTITSLPKK